MKKLFVSIAVMLLCLTALSTAFADRMYILPDSNKRRLSRDEIEIWDYESLGYAFNEIFARHGYNFNPGQDYDKYFSAMPWYTPNDNPNNETAVYPYLSSIEWENYHLILEVRSSKKYNDWGLSIWDNFSVGFDVLQGFEYIELRSNQELPVYSAPSTASWRGANGLAEASTNGAIYAAGIENGWLLMMYEINSNAVRVGYVDLSRITGPVPSLPYLRFAYDPAEVLMTCVLTDDPARSGSPIATLRPGVTVTYLTSYYSNSAWDYVETYVNGKTVRGFIPSGSLDIDMGATPMDNFNY